MTVRPELPIRSALLGLTEVCLSPFGPCPVPTWLIVSLKMKRSFNASRGMLEVYTAWRIRCEPLISAKKPGFVPFGFGTLAHWATPEVFYPCYF